jgi:threonine/homoserine/homoserine lactone efflux protein
MVYSFFLKGLIIGFSLAVPVGPIALLCIRRTLARGRAAGIFSGFGAAAADMVYGLIAGFGVTVVSNFLITHEMVLRIIGGTVLCYLGVRIFRSIPQEKSETPDENSLWRYFATTFFLTLTNPVTLIAFAAIFAAAGVGAAAGDFVAVGALVLGVFSGSLTWWLILSGIVSIFHGTLSVTALRIVNRASGTIIAGIGVVVLLTSSGVIELRKFF